MSHDFRFVTSRFDPTKEPANEVNPIAGHGALAWLCGKLRTQGMSVSEPAAEDWGWFVDASTDDATYLIGASGEAEGGSPDVEWIIQLHIRRSMKDRLLGRNKLATDDPLSLAIEKILRQQPDFHQLAVDREA